MCKEKVMGFLLGKRFRARRRNRNRNRNRNRKNRRGMREMERKSGLRIARVNRM